MGRWSSISGLGVITLAAVVLGAEEVKTGLAGADLAALLCSALSGMRDEILDGLDLFVLGI